jgi:hypothetical protein
MTGGKSEHWQFFLRKKNDDSPTNPQVMLEFTILSEDNLLGGLVVSLVCQCDGPVAVSYVPCWGVRRGGGRHCITNSV